jgi:hypothetical protein
MASICGLQPVGIVRSQAERENSKRNSADKQ